MEEGKKLLFNCIDNLETLWGRLHFFKEFSMFSTKETYVLRCGTICFCF